MKKLIIAISLIFVSTFCSAQITVDSIKPYWNSDYLDSIYIGYTSHIPHFDTMIYHNNSNDLTVRLNLVFIGCSTSVGIQKDTVFYFFNDSIFVHSQGGVRLSTFWNVSSICSAPTSPVVTFSTTIFPTITSIEEFKILENIISIYPNPVRDYFTINVQEEIQITQVELMDLQGRLVKNYQSNKTKLALSEISSGVYFVKITTSKGIAMKKIVVD